MGVRFHFVRVFATLSVFYSRHITPNISQCMRDSIVHGEARHHFYCILIIDSTTIVIASKISLAGSIDFKEAQFNVINLNENKRNLQDKLGLIFAFAMKCENVVEKTLFRLRN